MAEDGEDVGGAPMSMLEAAARFHTAAEDLRRHRAGLGRWRHALAGHGLADGRTSEAFALSCDTWSSALDRLAVSLDGLDHEIALRSHALLEAGGG